MTGEWTGKVRSTPTPKLTLRTVKVSRTPVPWRRTTAPWKTWTRSRVPSTTRTCTLTVSPGRKSGMSSRRLSRSMMSVGFMGRVFPRIVRTLPRRLPDREASPAGRSDQGVLHDVGVRCEHRAGRCRRGSPIVAVIAEYLHLTVLHQQSHLVPGQPAPGLDEVRAPFQRADHGLDPAPPLHPTVVAGAEHLGHVPTPEGRRPGVLGILEQAVREALLAGGALVAEHIRQQPDHCLDHHQRNQLPAGQHQVPHRELLVDKVVGPPLVATLVAAAQEREPVDRLRQPVGPTLVEP